MDSNSLYYSLDLVAGSGHTLSVEQRAALQTSLVIVQKNYKFHRVLFWGKILGLKEDYFIAQGRGEDEMEGKKNLYRCDGPRLLFPSRVMCLELDKVKLPVSVSLVRLLQLQLHGLVPAAPGHGPHGRAGVQSWQGSLRWRPLVRVRAS